MARYVALLRGINVGGKNAVSMKELKAALVEEGFGDVVSYINSGNILFTWEKADEGLLQARCGEVIRQRFGLEVPVAVFSAEDYLAAMAHAPDWWGREADTVHNATFVIPPATAPEVVAMVGPLREEYERLAYHGQAVFWSAARKTYSRARWPKVMGTSAYGMLTTRNVNTARKLAGMLEDG